jgi:Homeodomain-like domain
MEKTNDKKEYRRAQAVLEKAEGNTHKAIAKEHDVNERIIQRWITTYIKKGTEGLQVCRNIRFKSSITNGGFGYNLRLKNSPFFSPIVEWEMLS